MERRGQAAVEYLVLTGFTMLLLMVLLVASYSKVSASEKQIAVDSARRAVSALKAAADFVYVHGHPTKLTVSVYLPPDLEPSGTFVGNGTVNLAVRVGSGHTDVWESTRGEVGWDLQGSSSFPSSEGYYVFVVESTAYASPHAGKIDIHE